MAFLAEGRQRAVAGDEGGVVAQGPELFADGADQGVMIAAGRIRTADGALKQHIADKGHFVFGAMKNDMARGMTGTMAHGHGYVAKTDGFAPIQPSVRGK